LSKAQYVDDLNTQMTEKSINPTDMDAWIKLGFDVQSNAQQAPYTFLQLAMNMGLTKDQIAEAVGIATGPQGLDDDLQKMVSDFELTEEVAAKLQAQRTPVPTTPTIQAPVAQAPTQTPAPMADPSSLPTLSNPSGVTEEQAVEAVNAIDAEFADKYPEGSAKWREELRTKLSEKQGLPFHLWRSTTRELADLIVKSHQQKVVKPNRSATRGSRTRAPAKKKDSNTQDGLIERMTSGKILS